MDLLKKIVDKFSKNGASKFEIAKAIIYINYKINGVETTIVDINDSLIKNNLTKCNSTYLKDYLKRSKDISSGAKAGKFRPLKNYIDIMDIECSELTVKSEEIITDELIIPSSLAVGTRGYIVSLTNQINGSYHHNIFDGCAILMRRLLEILLIHAYQHMKREMDIKEADGYKKLNTIINQVISDKPFSLSKNTLGVLHTFRELGNFSAHSIQYNARRTDINNVKMAYRVAVEELLYLSNLKT